MQEIIDAATNLPILVQGALGSGLFWLVLLFLNLSRKWLFSHAVLLGKKARKDILEDRRFFYRSVVSNDHAMLTLSSVALLFAAFRNFMHALICLVIGFIFSQFLSVFLYIGCLFALYFLLVASIRVGDLHTTDDSDITERIEEIDLQIGKAGE
ncbi:hypothetical protein ACJO5Y_16400 [Marinobacter sp. GN3S48]|uniref:hypothetical protein n=1 Tax=Marinobacter sp. GN3S48 TaxID=3382302 RepID=UPI00387B4BD1